MFPGDANCVVRHGLATPLATLLVKCDLNHWQNLVVILLTTFERKEIIITAAPRQGKFTANQWSRVIDSAPASFGIKELAGSAEDRIFLAAQHLLLLPSLSKTKRRSFD